MGQADGTYKRWEGSIDTGVSTAPSKASFSAEPLTDVLLCALRGYATKLLSRHVKTPDRPDTNQGQYAAGFVGVFEGTPVFRGKTRRRVRAGKTTAARASDPSY